VIFGTLIQRIIKNKNIGKEVLIHCGLYSGEYLEREERNN
jgi:hypothetical protein